ncbi:MAG: serpin family protein, partial [Bacteroidota bacterium]
LDQAHSSSETLLNFLCVQEGIKLEKEYLDKVKAHFLLEPNYFDFRANAAGVREQLNQQVAKKTQNVIPEFLSARQVNGATRLLIANTFLFDGPWRHAFEKNATKKGTFYTLEGVQKEVPFMFLSNKRVNYFENEKYQVLELPYQDSNFGFLIILPKEKKGILELDREMNYPTYLNLSTIKKSQEEAISFEEIAQEQVFVPQDIDLYLPRFSFAEQWDMKSILEENGVRQIFTREANLSAMLDNADLMVDAFVHETHIEVNEWGTRASAKTTVSMVEKSIPQTKLVRADHPFFFVIRDHQNGAILFMGRVMQP